MQQVFLQRFTLNPTGARGRIDGTGQPLPIYVVVKRNLKKPIGSHGKVANQKNTHADMTWHDMPWHDMLT
jgi:hypothetical protein